MAKLNNARAVMFVILSDPEHLDLDLDKSEPSSSFSPFRLRRFFGSGLGFGRNCELCYTTQNGLFDN